MYRNTSCQLPRLLLGLAVGVALLAGCTGIADNGNGPAGTSAPHPGSGGGGGVSTGTAGAVGDNLVGDCEGDIVTNTKRVVRLSFSQISRAVHALFGDDLGAKVDETALIGPRSQTPRTFPPLSSATEGSTIIATTWQSIDAIAAQTAEYTLANLSGFTGCASPVNDACAQTFLLAFAQKAFRRPLTSGERASLTQVYSDVKSIFGTVPEAVQYGVYAVMQAPGFVYRTELGSLPGQDGPLTPYELASALSFFLTDAPPDATLLDAAAQAKLESTAEITNQVGRILSTTAAKTNLEDAMFSYFALDNLDNVVIDDAQWTEGLKNSAYTESELFLASSLWDLPISGLLTSKKTRINQNLAALYGVAPFPPAGAALDVNGFAPVELPENRAGILTQVGFLAARSRPDTPSVVGRGLAINAALLCAANPPRPEDQTTLAGIEAQDALTNQTERQKAEYRAMTSPCGGCHNNFDAYGLALENYDSIGRYRTVDALGQTINSSVTMPSLAGGGTAANAVEMADKIASSPGFVGCIAKNMINWALAEGSPLTPTSCAAKTVAARFSAGDKTFSTLLTEIAASQTFTNRKAGVNP